ncbi:MAG: 6,7-dimethyl-8-ribityllumazine synthase [Candidatus Moranbacteria bacterium]|jgi:6,7-dimethyl-8-ribityllumazine synthase|nr:6,7-dimethyl-8-ribityllumazine synthase [Candidatus Moranbacteria bacterium]MDD5651882.1 6,7-dimethyl-8-ribityllumazine synthase [Candidatus Moranbacteria bacterium]MDX9855343.1 6,7-dimethyl-8-ribityllumazine synthase [Candidatus Moranbacteria bacterium]
MQRKNKKDNKIIDGKDLRIGIIASEFNWDIVGSMLEGALDLLKKNNVKKESIKIVKVPGSFEIPLACQKLAHSDKFDALIALGCVIKGETGHYYYVAGEASKGVMDVMLKFSLPIGFGIITTDNLAQAKKRSGGKNNKGKEAAEAALRMILIK